MMPTPIGNAAKHGHIGAVRLLIDNGAVIDSHAICRAAHRGHMDILRLMIDHCANVNIQLRKVVYCNVDMMLIQI